MADFTLSDLAVATLEDIHAYGIKTFGETQAVHYNAGFFRQFDLLAQFPGMGLPVEWPGKPLLVCQRCCIPSRYDIRPTFGCRRLPE